MKNKILILGMVLAVCCGSAHAQWVVTDPTNFAGNIVNTVKEIATASKTVKNTLNNFKEVEKVYHQGKKYYDALKTVNNLIGDAYKVKEIILMVGDITDIYVTGYRSMLKDSAMASGYAKLLEMSGESLKELKTLLKNNALSMNDKERMELINRIYDEVREYRAVTSYFTQKNISVSFVRAAEKGELERVNSLYGSGSSRYW